MPFQINSLPESSLLILRHDHLEVDRTAHHAFTLRLLRDSGIRDIEQFGTSISYLLSYRPTNCHSTYAGPSARQRPRDAYGAGERTRDTHTKWIVVPSSHDKRERRFRDGCLHGSHQLTTRPKRCKWLVSFPQCLAWPIWFGIRFALRGLSVEQAGGWKPIRDCDYCRPNHRPWQIGLRSIPRYTDAIDFATV